jgi:Domain of unknown function (DUF4129)
MMRYFLYLLINLTALQIMVGQKPSASVVTEAEVKESASKTELDKMKGTWVPKSYNQKKIEDKMDIGQNIGAIGEVLKLFAIVVISCFAILLLFLIFKDVWRNRKLQEATEVELDNIQDITGVNFEALLKEALDKKDYRLATRIKFLTMLQQLQNKQKIVWKPNKTNRAYSAELADGYLGTSFRELSSIFERIWYGHKDVEEQQYMEISTQFDSMQKLI